MEIIKKLERQMGRKFRKVDINDVERFTFAITVDKEGHVLGLNLYNLGISDISFLKYLTNLTILNLLENQISDIAPLKDLINLTHLILRNNQINNITALQNHKKLLKLDLSFNQISDISAIKKITSLTHLYLPGNKIQDISHVKHLANVIKLGLWRNQITDISPIKNLKNLAGLGLDQNEITDISALKDLTNLSKLGLMNNQISDITALKNLKKLSRLNLAQNNISDISAIKDLKHLIQLDLRDNKISELTTDYLNWDLEIKWKFDNLYGIFLEGNPIERPPVEIIKQGTASITAYFKSLKGEEKKALNEVKVLLVGDGGAGKTSLVKLLLGETFDRNESQTHGINIKHCNVKRGKDKIMVNIWDFGGQEVMHATHQFFLSKRSLYILVLDSRKDDKTENWLKHIQSFGGDSPILVVINKIDENPGFDVNRRFLQEKYESIKGFYRLSCATGEGVKAFSKHFIDELLKVDLLHTTWPENWFNIKTKLSNMTKSYISYHEYKTLCETEHEYDDIAMSTLLGVLNILGVVLHFKDFRLQQTSVLNPEWVTTAVYKIINNKEIADAGGLLKLRFLDDILKREKDSDFSYPSDIQRYIIDLMEKFELCFSVDKETILIPDLLEVQEPFFEFDYDTSLKFFLDYDFLPRSVMPRFIVKMSKDIKEDLNWRTGVVLEDKSDECTAVVKVDYESKRIYIYVQGDLKRDYFSNIRKVLRDINKSFERLEVVEKIPLPENEQKTVKYSELIGLKRMGIKEYVKGELEKTFSVDQLLDGIERGEDSIYVRPNLKDATVPGFYIPKIEVKQGPITVTQNQSTNATQISNQKQTVHIDINKELPRLQEDFSDLKDLIVKYSPSHKGKMKEIMESLDDVTPKSSKEKLGNPLNKIHRLLSKFSDENSDMHKVIVSAKKGIEMIQKVAETYNKFAQWVGLPVIPKILLKTTKR